MPYLELNHMSQDSSAGITQAKQFPSVQFPSENSTKWTPYLDISG